MISLLLRIVPWVVGIGKNLGTAVPWLGKIGGSVRMGFYTILWALAWGGSSAMAVGAVVGFLGSMAAGLSLYAGAMAVARDSIPSDIRCTLDYIHVFRHLRNLAITGIALLSLRVGVLAYKFGSAAYRNFAMGLLDRLKGKVSPITGV